jgi:hypothetical protein
MAMAMAMAMVMVMVMVMAMVMVMNNVLSLVEAVKLSIGDGYAMGLAGLRTECLRGPCVVGAPPA